jgi:hypothetical protein
MVMRFVVLFVFLVCGVGLASGSVSDPCAVFRVSENAPVSAGELTCRVSRLIEGVGLIRIVDWVGFSFVMLFFVIRLLRNAVSLSDSRMVWSIVMSSGVALSGMLMLPELRVGVSQLYSGVYSLSSSASRIVFSDSMSELSGLLSEVSAFASVIVGTCMAFSLDLVQDDLISDEVMLPGVGVGLFSGDVSLSTVVVLAGVGDEVVLSSLPRDLAKHISDRLMGTILPVVATLASGLVRAIVLSLDRLVDYVLIPVISLNHMINFAGSLTMIVSSMVLPVGFVMLSSGAGLGFFVAWFKIVVAALLTMGVFPVVWGIGVHLAVIQPVRAALVGFRRANDAWVAGGGDAQAQLNAAMSALNALVVMLVNSGFGLVIAIGVSFMVSSVVVSFLNGATVSIGGLKSTKGSGFVTDKLGGGSSKSKGKGGGSRGGGGK